MEESQNIYEKNGRSFVRSGEIVESKLVSVTDGSQRYSIDITFVNGQLGIFVTDNETGTIQPYTGPIDL